MSNTQSIIIENSNMAKNRKKKRKKAYSMCLKTFKEHI